jgi:quercetin dioxygenase-like cupin family protein
MRGRSILIGGLKFALAVLAALFLLALTDYVELRIVREAGGLAAAQRKQPPSVTVGQSEELLRSLDLTSELRSVDGRPLRMRRITVQPGGALALHNHIDRPAVTYMLRGEMTYHYADGRDAVLRAGEGFAEGRATTHWAENTGKEPAIWIAVDIPAQ